MATADGSVYTFGRETGQGRRLKPGKGATYFLHFRLQVNAVNVMTMRDMAQDRVSFLLCRVAASP